MPGASQLKPLDFGNMQAEHETKRDHIKQLLQAGPNGSNWEVARQAE